MPKGKNNVKKYDNIRKYNSTTGEIVKHGRTSDSVYGGMGTGGSKRKKSKPLKSTNKKMIRKSKKMNQAKGRKYRTL